MPGLCGVGSIQKKWDFSRLSGVYVTIFALISILCGRFLFKGHIPIATWVGLALIVCGGMIIQFFQKI